MPVNFLSTFYSELDLFTLLSLVVLLGMSVFSWAILVAKSFSLKRIEKETLKFIDELESRARFAEILSSAEKKSRFPAQKMFLYASNELSRLKKVYPQDAIPKNEASLGLDRVFELVVTKFQRVLTQGFSALASISTSAPFVGLFGTVTGVLHTLYGLGGEQAVLGFNKLAPSLSVALVATACGLFVAIPASLGYNHLRNRMRTVQFLLREVEIYIAKRFLD